MKINANIKYTTIEVEIIMITKNITNILLFLNPMQFEIQGQWWSNSIMQILQIEQ